VWMVSLRGWAPAILLAIWAGLVLRRLRPQVWSGAGLVAITLWVLIWGISQQSADSRLVLAFNAERYLYHGFLLVFPAVAVLFSVYWNRCSGRRGMRGVLVILVLVPFLQLPPLTYKSGNLLSEEPLIVSADALRAYDWISENTRNGDVIFQKPVPGPAGAQRFDRSLPAFTGRSLYVADVYNIWGYANIPAYEHRARVEFVRRVGAGQYRPEALARECAARGIDYVLIQDAGAGHESDPILRSERFRTVYDRGAVTVVKPVSTGSPSKPR
jgi:hypothetical protein